MGEEFVWQDRGVGFDFDEVDGYGGHFGEHDTPEGVGEGEIHVTEDEVYGEFAGLFGTESLLEILLH
jgi:hypothetical protein